MSNLFDDALQFQKELAESPEKLISNQPPPPQPPSSYSFFSILPAEVIERIFNYLSKSDAADLTITCRPAYRAFSRKFGSTPRTRFGRFKALPTTIIQQILLNLQKWYIVCFVVTCRDAYNGYFHLIRIDAREDPSLGSHLRSAIGQNLPDHYYCSRCRIFHKNQYCEPLANRYLAEHAYKCQRTWLRNLAITSGYYINLLHLYWLSQQRQNGTRPGGQTVSLDFQYDSPDFDVSISIEARVLGRWVYLLRNARARNSPEHVSELKKYLPVCSHLRGYKACRLNVVEFFYHLSKQIPDDDFDQETFEQVWRCRSCDFLEMRPRCDGRYFNIETWIRFERPLVPGRDISKIIEHNLLKLGPLDEVRDRFPLPYSSGITIRRDQPNVELAENPFSLLWDRETIRRAISAEERPEALRTTHGPAVRSGNTWGENQILVPGLRDSKTLLGV